MIQITQTNRIFLKNSLNNYVGQIINQNKDLHSFYCLLLAQGEINYCLKSKSF